MRVAVGLSGGVDSSTAALLLKDRGHEVIGITLRFHREECTVGLSHNVCCSPQDVRDAKEVSDALGIPHLTLDWEVLFRERVIERFISEYERGRTPNPCALCNREVKTGFLARYLREVAEIDRLATGHYALCEEHPRFGRIIRRGVDRKRDQSYFLALVRREDIELLEFPLGGMTKEEVRRIAEERGLKVARKRDSQEVCFLMGRSVGEFLEERIGKKEGEIVHLSGRVLGTHRGIYNYTVGQRRGLGVSYGSPLYVLGMEPETGKVIVGEEKYLYRRTIRFGNANFNVPPEEWGSRVLAQIRYRQRPVEVEDMAEEGETYRVRLKEPVKGVAPGQVIAFYQEDVLLGGGIIEGAEDHLP